MKGTFEWETKLHCLSALIQKVFAFRSSCRLHEMIVSACGHSKIHLLLCCIHIIIHILPRGGDSILHGSHFLAIAWFCIS